MNDRVDWQEVFNSQVRAIQSLHPKAHHAMRNWGLWSRELQGIFPTIAKPGWTEFYRAPEEWAEEDDLQAATMAAQTEPLKTDRPDRPRSDERQGEEMDIRIHRHGFPTIWRRVLRAAYLSLEIPEYHFPRVAGVGYEGYLVFLDSALANLERAMEK